MMSPVEVNDETLALDVIDKIGPDGNFMAAKHTRQHYKDDWAPQLFERRNYETWYKDGSKSMRQRAQEKALEILANHQPEPLAEDIVRQLDKIVAEAGINDAW